ncbi:hypothetical protein [Bacillus manliponensis]|uniref:hypothetical protein n=1 Tax=Bacillus manliponensis TaxID=574376 RepID=UPI0006916390|nr:hypothetical protein [Bacillus manliponensis]
MIYIKYNNTGEIELIHSAPFHSELGLGKTKEELEKEGFFVNSIPEAEHREGKVAILKCNVTTKTLYYLYVDKPLTQEEVLKNLQKENEELKRNQKLMWEKIEELMKSIPK